MSPQITLKDSSSDLANVSGSHPVDPSTRFFLVGIGGAGMSVVAQLLHQLGYPVAGSDREEVDTLPALRQAGIQCLVGHRAQNLEPGDVLVVSSAIRADNPEYLRAVELGLEIWHRSMALAFCTQRHRLVAVAGAHGKTSTSSMISHALYTANQDPSFAIGGIITAFGTGARLGGGDAFVIEADESDGSFLNYSPQIEVLTNIEADHLDHWGSAEAFEQAFVDFTSKLRPGGSLVLCADDPAVARLAPRFNPAAQVISYGFGPALPQSVIQVSLYDPRLGAGSGKVRVEVRRQGCPVYRGEVRLAVGGEHMLLNAGAALGAAYALGVDLGTFVEGLATFSGAARRMQFLGEVEGVRIYDDYGHHPTELAVTMRAARDLAAPGRLLVCFQPHLYSRTYTFSKEFAQALDQADRVVTCGVYAAREDPLPGINGNTVSDLMGEKARFVENMYAAGLAAFHAAKPGDLLLFQGAGSITHVAHELSENGVAGLQAKAQEGPAA